ncbi:CPBP family intramembrane glutamic endopeptidase [Mariniblastus fucicola]|nr:CPBP family intramembrane glutamic endopeptidase [Mariniblastus fucicola]
MSIQLQQPERKKPGSVLEVLDAKTQPVKKKAVRYDYWLETHNPLACLAFMLPLLIWYEVSMALEFEAVRSGIDRIVQMVFSPLGQASIVILPLVSVGLFLFLHHRQKQPGQFHLRTVFWMAIESIALATILFLACDILLLYLDNQRPQPLAGLATVFSDSKQYGRLLMCLGTGIHEELVFRLLIFAPLFCWLCRVTQRENVALFLAAILVSCLFAVAHCDAFNPEGSPFQMSTFLFRFLASVFLCVLFRFRGIAIAIGVHAVFDILAIS